MCWNCSIKVGGALSVGVGFELVVRIEQPKKQVAVRNMAVNKGEERFTRRSCPKERLCLGGLCSGLLPNYWPVWNARLAVQVHPLLE